MKCKNIVASLLLSLLLVNKSEAICYNHALLTLAAISGTSSCISTIVYVYHRRKLNQLEETYALMTYNRVRYNFVESEVNTAQIRSHTKLVTGAIALFTGGFSALCLALGFTTLC